MSGLVTPDPLAVFCRNCGPMWPEVRAVVDGPGIRLNCCRCDAVVVFIRRGRFEAFLDRVAAKGLAKAQDRELALGAQA